MTCVPVGILPCCIVLSGGNGQASVDVTSHPTGGASSCDGVSSRLSFCNAMLSQLADCTQPFVQLPHCQWHVCNKQGRMQPVVLALCIGCGWLAHFLLKLPTFVCGLTSCCPQLKCGIMVTVVLSWGAELLFEYLPSDWHDAPGQLS